MILATFKYQSIRVRKKLVQHPSNNISINKYVFSDLESIYLPLPLLLMGGCSVVAGGVAALLPETQGRKLPQTIQDAKMKS